MTHQILDKAALRALYNSELKAAFPLSELKPLHAMERLRAADCYEPTAFYDEEGLAGYALLWTHEGAVLLDYFGVPEARRNQGLGSKILRELVPLLGERVMILEAEAPDGGAEDALRQRRLDFYLRAGCVMLPYDCALFGVHYNCLAMNCGDRDAQTVLQLHHALYRKHMLRAMDEAYVQIPLLPGEKATPFHL